MPVAVESLCSVSKALLPVAVESLCSVSKALLPVVVQSVQRMKEFNSLLLDVVF